MEDVSEFNQLSKEVTASTHSSCLKRAKGKKMVVVHNESTSGEQVPSELTDWRSPLQLAQTTEFYIGTYWARWFTTTCLLMLKAYPTISVRP